MSVSGGCSGLPDHPRSPLNVRPRNVNAGRNEKWRMSGLLGPPYDMLSPFGASHETPNCSADALRVGSRRHRAPLHGEVHERLGGAAWQLEPAALEGRNPVRDEDRDRSLAPARTAGHGHAAQDVTPPAPPD